jgi:ribonucleoside-diphosphate reductase alpha chain
MTTRQKLPHRRAGVRVTLRDSGQKVYLCTGEYEDGRLGEIFLDTSKEGSFSRDALHAFAMAVSLGLQHGIPLAAFIHTYRNHKMEPDFIRQIFSTLAEIYPSQAQEAQP